MSEPATRRKRGNLKVGDVFEMEMPDGRLGYGAILIARKILYVIVLRDLYEERPPMSALVSAPVALVGWTMDALIYHGRWKIAFRGYPDRSDIPYPNWKVEVSGALQTTNFAGDLLGPCRADEVDLLDFKFSYSPIVYQSALEAVHGLGEWKADYEELTPPLAFKRMTRAAN